MNFTICIESVFYGMFWHWKLVSKTMWARWCGGGDEARSKLISNAQRSTTMATSPSLQLQQHREATGMMGRAVCYQEANECFVIYFVLNLITHSANDNEETLTETPKRQRHRRDNDTETTTTACPSPPPSFQQRRHGDVGRPLSRALPHNTTMTTAASPSPAPSNDRRR